MPTRSSSTAPARPFVKWAGGKRSILPVLLERVPARLVTYAEPFVGGGALFFALRAAGFNQPAHLSDSNERLVTTYEVVRDDVDALIDVVAFHAERHDECYYKAARRELSVETDPLKVAALLVYLNKTCFNGVYRVNRAGDFNMGIGTLDSSGVLDAENLRQASAALQGVTVARGDFADTDPVPGGFYYLDPPYHGTYTSYTTSRFDEDDQRRVAEFCRRIDAAGGMFLASNADTPFIRSLYDGFGVDVVMARRTVSCAAHQRGRTGELLVGNC